MTQTRRLILNTIATTARALFQVVCGLLTGRWMLLALGKEDYGLLGLVGGLIVFMTIFNTVFSSAISRYYAYSVGAAKNSGAEGLAECRSWFSVAVLIYCVLPLAVFAMGYPVGEWAVRHWLTIAPERVEACVWVFRFSCLSCFIGMIGIPFRAMYVAKQEIAELTIYTFVTTTLNVVVLYYMVTHAGDWLVRMSAWMMLLVVVPATIIAIRAFIVFPECRIVPRAMRDFGRIRKLVSFAGWQLFGNLGVIVRDQGNAILVNKFLGPVFNASNTVSSTVSGHAQMFANEVNGAFFPAITNACGAGDRALMSRLVQQCSKYSALFVAYLIVPLILEMPAIITLWLKDPPPMAAGLCCCACLVCLINKITCGQWMAVDAGGRIAKLQMVLFLCYSFTAVIVWVAFSFGGGVLWVGYASVMTMSLVSLSRIILARTLGGVSARLWFSSVLVPVGIVCLCGISCGLALRSLLHPSVLRIFVVCGVTELILLSATWVFALTIEERQFVLEKIHRFLGKAWPRIQQ